MSESRRFILAHRQAREGACKAVQAAKEGWVVVIQPPTRSGDQNAAMWPILKAFSEQLQWPVNGKLEWMTEDEWKDVLSAAYRKEVRVAQGLDGMSFVMLGQRTSKFSKREFSDWMDFLHSVAAERGVNLEREMA